MRSLLLPTTDVGVVVQVVLVAAVTGALVWRLRADRDVARLVAGIGVLLLAGAALRAVH